MIGNESQAEADGGRLTGKGQLSLQLGWNENAAFKTQEEINRKQTDRRLEYWDILWSQL